MMNFDDIIVDIKCGQIIPIIGDEVLYIENESGEAVPLQNFILQELNAQYGQQVQEYSFKNMAVFERLSKCRNAFIRSIYGIIDNRKIKIDPRVLRFLRNGEFPLIITTTCTDVLERALNDYVSVDYSRAKTDDISEIDNNDKKKRLAKKTIFHLFGRLDDSGITRCVVTEDDLLKYLHGLSDTNTSPQKLREYIQNKDLARREILALGCNIPDWVFRFLLYSMVKDDLFDNRPVSEFKGGVIDSANDANLATFLENIAYYYGNDILGFIEEINSRLEEINSRLQPQKRHSIFVSVFSKDLNSKDHGNQIRGIIDELKTKYDVWFYDDRLEHFGGEDYWGKIIRKGLNECEFFLPIITYKVLNLIPSVNGPEPTQDPHDPGVINEWKYAIKALQDCDSKLSYVLPYRFGGVDDEDLKNVFDTNLCEKNPGVAALCNLIFGGIGSGIQHITSADEIDLEKLLKQ